MKTRKAEEKEKRRNKLNHTAMVYVAFFFGVLVMSAIGEAFFKVPSIVTAILEIPVIIPLAIMLWTDPELRD